MKKLLSAAAATLLTMGVAQTALAAVQIVNANGKLVGATGVLVDGVVYDVSLVEGTCASAYGTCAVSSFDFSTQAGGYAAALALSEQVFLDTASGNFDTTPSLTYGCEHRTTCQTFIAYGFDQNTGFTLNAYANNSLSSDFATSNVSYLPDFDTVNSTSAVYARFSRVAAIPEPAMWGMMLVGFGMVGAASRYRRRSPKVIYA